MDSERISKKELLEQTGISYGQLYRWKRERLIPEEWFVKQSAFTGQETYFPREQVLARVQAILNLKDTHSLEEMAQIFSPKPGSAIAVEDLIGFEPLNKKLLFALLEEGGDTRTHYSSGEVVFLVALSPYIGKEGFDVGAAVRLANSVFTAAGRNVPSSSSCTLFKLGSVADGAGVSENGCEGASGGKGGSANDCGGDSAPSDFHVVFCPGPTPPLFDGEIAVIGALELGKNAELLGSYLQTIGQRA